MLADVLASSPNLYFIIKMIQIANPIYDAVFKYFVEDDRIGKILISALLQKEIVEVDMRRHEYTNGNREHLALFRVDFAARVREDDGSIHLVLIELQKAWVETETLRFRQYLATQYNNKENVQTDGYADHYGIPMIAVYLLGHKLNGITEPVLYVNHVAFDYNGLPLPSAIKNPYVQSLIHDCIMVQIPYLSGRVTTHLEKVLSVFDQSKRNKNNGHVLTIDEEQFAGDDDMLYMFHRLSAAASDADVRREMDVEDEYYSAIENRDEAIAMRDKKIAEQDGTIAEQNDTIAEQNDTIAEQKNAIAQKDTALTAMARQLLAQGMSVKDVAKLAGVTESEIESLQNPNHQ